MNTPNPRQIIERRVNANLTQSQAAAVVHAALRTWQDWESGKTKMHAGLWELFTIKVKQ